jgi:outer membrane protein TolC
MRSMKKNIESGVMISMIFIWILSMPFSLSAQQILTLDECFEGVAVNYPLAKQSALLNDKNQFDIEIINKGRLPKIDINAQATYQSDVTMLPTDNPMISVTPPNKDQYRATVDVNQLIYGGGLIDASVKLNKAAQATAQQALDVTLYGLKEQVNMLYMSVLLLQENRQLIKAKEAQLQAKINEVSTGVKSGVVLSSAVDALSVEMLKIKQQYTELDFNRNALIQRLSLLIGKEIALETEFIQPSVLLDESAMNRPELQLFNLKQTQIDYSSEIITKSRLPKVNGFAQGGYGNPGLNMLDNTFNTFYMVGVKLNWNAFDWNRSKTEKQSMEINKSIINAEREAFELNNNLELVNIQSDINKLEALIVTDNEIIALRESLMKTADSQLKNGVITTAGYMTEFTNLYEAKNNLNLRKTQLLLKQIQYQLTNGTYTITKN